MQSSSDRTRHIDIRYFFIKDIIKREAIDIHYCPTEQMIADFYTKPLQGGLFKALRDYIMGHSGFVSSKERVEEKSIVDVRKSCESNRNVTATYADILKIGLNQNFRNNSDKFSKPTDREEKRLSIEKREILEK